MIKIKNFSIILAFVIFLFPSYLNTIPYIENIVLLLKILVLVIVLLRYFTNDKISIFILALALFFIVRIIITFYFNGYQKIIIGSAIPTMGLCLLCDYLIKRETKKMLSYLNIVLSLYVYLNFLTIILFPQGLYFDGTIPSYFMGSPNSFSMTIIPALALSMIHSYCVNNKLNNNFKIMFLVSIITSLITSSTTLLICISLFTILLLLYKRNKIHKLFNFYNLTIVFLFFFLFVTFSKIQHFFSFFIENVLGKSLTLSGRTYLWEIAYELIGNSLWFGYGGIEGGRYIWYMNNYALSAHNFFLQTLLESGVTGLLLFISILFISGSNLMKFKTNIHAKLISFNIFIVFIGMTSEAPNNLVLVFLILLLGYRIPYLIDNMKS